jgi:hypothetical protein
MNFNPLIQKSHISELTTAGDYCFVQASNSRATILCCPVCGLLMDCSHTILNDNPLSLSPSVVGPENSNQALNCKHHFFIEEGTVRLV